MTNLETFKKEIEALDIPKLMQLEIKSLGLKYASAEWQAGFKSSCDITSKTLGILG